ncbi:ABC transporter permease, partial [Vibrio natriegens]
LGVSDVGNGTSFAVLGLFTAILYGICYYLISRGIGLRS